MTIHREGYTIILIASAIAALCIGLCFSFLPWLWLSILISSGLLIIWGLIVWFFRVPKRAITLNDSLIYAPADGKVVVIEKYMEDEYFQETRLFISIFMSPLNVHRQTYPVSGKVIYQQYHPGKYFVAWHPKSSTLNERTTVVIEHDKGKIMFRQIAGAMARRIKCYAKEGALAAQHEEAGFIKFGSRVDIILPPNATPLVELGQHVQSTTTPLAKW